MVSGSVRTTAASGKYLFRRTHEKEKRLSAARMTKVLPAFGKLSHKNPGIVSPTYT